MTTTSKQFHISDVLTVIDGHLLSTRHMDGVYEILNFLTGDNLYTHQLPRAFQEAEPYLREQFPRLAAIEVPSLSTPEEVKAWVETLYDEYGDYIELEPLPPGVHEFREPLSELAEMMPGKPIIAVVAGGEQS